MRSRAGTLYYLKSERTRKYRRSPKPRTTPRGRPSTRARSCGECPTRARRFWKRSPEAEKSTNRCFPTARTGKSRTTPTSAFPDSKRACATASKRWRMGKSNAPSPTSARPTNSPWWSSCAGAPSGSQRERPTRASACRGASQTTRPSSPRSRGSRAPAARASSPPTGSTGATTPR